MLGIERTLVSGRVSTVPWFDVTSPTSAANAGTEVVGVLTAEEPLHVAMERLALSERLGRTLPSSLSAVPGRLVSARLTRLMWERPAATDSLVARLLERRHRLFWERGLFTDSVEMIRELRDHGP